MWVLTQIWSELKQPNWILIPQVIYNGTRKLRPRVRSSNKIHTAVMVALNRSAYKSYLRLARAAPLRDWIRRVWLIYLSINSSSRKLTAMDAMKEIHFPLVWSPVERTESCLVACLRDAASRLRARVSCSVYDASLPNHRARAEQTRHIYLRTREYLIWYQTDLIPDYLVSAHYRFKLSGETTQISQDS